MSSVKYRNKAKGQASNDDLHHIINDMQHVGNDGEQEEQRQEVNFNVEDQFYREPEVFYESIKVPPEQYREIYDSAHKDLNSEMQVLLQANSPRHNLYKKKFTQTLQKAPEQQLNFKLKQVKIAANKQKLNPYKSTQEYSTIQLQDHMIRRKPNIYHRNLLPRERGSLLQIPLLKQMYEGYVPIEVTTSPHLLDKNRKPKTVEPGFHEKPKAFTMAEFKVIQQEKIVSRTGYISRQISNEIHEKMVTSPSNPKIKAKEKADDIQKFSIENYQPETLEITMIQSEIEQAISETVNTDDIDEEEIAKYMALQYAKNLVEIAAKVEQKKSQVQSKESSMNDLVNYQYESQKDRMMKMSSHSQSMIPEDPNVEKGSPRDEYGHQQGYLSENNQMYDPTGLGVHSQVHTMRDQKKPRTSEATYRSKVNSQRGMDQRPLIMSQNDSRRCSDFRQQPFNRAPPFYPISQNYYEQKCKILQDKGQIYAFSQSSNLPSSKGLGSTTFLKEQMNGSYANLNNAEKSNKSYSLNFSKPEIQSMSSTGVMNRRQEAQKRYYKKGHYQFKVPSMHSNERQTKSRDNARICLNSMTYGAYNNTIDQQSYQLETKPVPDDRPGSQRNFPQFASKTTNHVNWNEKTQVKLNRYLSGTTQLNQNQVQSPPIIDVVEEPQVITVDDSKETGINDQFYDKLIQDSIDNNDICIFMNGTSKMPRCNQSNFLVQILEFYGVKQFKDINVLDDENLGEHVKKFSESPTIPQLYIKGQMFRDLREYHYLRQALVENGLIKLQDFDNNSMQSSVKHRDLLVGDRHQKAQIEKEFEVIRPGPTDYFNKSLELNTISKRNFQAQKSHSIYQLRQRNQAVKKSSYTLAQIWEQQKKCSTIITKQKYVTPGPGSYDPPIDNHKLNKFSHISFTRDLRYNEKMNIEQSKRKLQVPATWK